ncbi:MAG: hypothetical protein WC593_15075 [Methanoregula sp.]
MSNIQFARNLEIWPGLRASVPMIVAQSNTASTTGDAETINVTGASVTIPKGFFSPGTAFRFTLFGSRTGTAGAATILLDLGGTTIATIAIPTNTAVDWMAVLTVTEHTDFKHQNVSEFVATSATVLSAYDTATGTVDVSNDITLKAQITLANASDSVTCNYVLVECWKVDE